nr:hypothetical protein [Tanacetum cinerariifolium]
MDQPNPTFAKILILDTRKFEQWKFRIQQYLQNKHYALREVIEFGDSYKAPLKETGKGPASESSTKKKGRTVVITTEDMQKRRNDVKARTTLLLALLDEHHHQKAKKNQLKQQYGNFKAKGLETLEQTFNRLQAIVSHLKFMDVEIEQDDLNQKFLTSLAPEWLMYTIVWRNRDDLDTISGNGEVHTASVPTASIQVSTISTDVAPASLSHDTVCAYIASQSNGLQIKYKDITQIDEDDIEEIDIKCNASIVTKWVILLESAEHLEVKTEEKEKATNKMANEEENHALVADDEALTEFALMAKSSSSLKNEVEARLVEFKEQEIKFCEKIRGLEKDVEEVKDQIRTRRVLDTVHFPPPDQVYSPPKKDLSWTGLPEFVDDTVTDYTRPTPSINESKCNTSNNFSIFEHGESSGSIMSKPMIKFVKAADCPRVTKTNNTKNARKSTIKYAEMYRNTTKSPKGNIDDKGYWDSGCSQHMTGNISYLFEYEPYDGGYVSFCQEGGKITVKGIIKTGKDFKLKDDTNVLLRTPRQHNMYSIDLNNIVPHKNLTCLVAKASTDESMLWHRRLRHLNFKTMNKLVRNNLVRGLPSKCFENDHTCVACLKEKQHKASCKTKLVNSVSKPLHTLHMDLFGLTSVSSLNHKWYCLVVTDDFS